MGPVLVLAWEVLGPWLKSLIMCVLIPYTRVVPNNVHTW